MKTSIAFIQIFLISIILSSCASRAPSMRMLDKRSNYDIDSPELLKIGENLTREKAKEVEIYIFPNEMPSGDYFQGGYIRAIVDGERWTYKKSSKSKKKKRKKKK